jgi:hypothetical protein
MKIDDGVKMDVNGNSSSNQPPGEQRTGQTPRSRTSGWGRPLHTDWYVVPFCLRRLAKPRRFPGNIGMEVWELWN